MQGTYLAIERMSPRKGGKGGLIINVASLSGNFHVILSKLLLFTGLFDPPYQDWAPYFVTKHGVVTFGKALTNDGSLFK